MRAGKLLPIFGPLFLMSVIGFAVGCGSSGGQARNAPGEGKAIGEDQKAARVDRKEERKASKAAEKGDRTSKKGGHGGQ
jgi:hypothetical protein